MTDSTVSLLTNPHPKSHIVYPYADEAQVTEAVGMYASEGLKRDEAVVLITTRQNRGDIEGRLQAEGFDTAALETAGILNIIEADSMLCRFLETGTPDPARFHKVIHDVILEARSNAPSGRVRIYGEMVNLLCGHNNLEAAAYLEDLWNQTIETYAVPLLCSYSSALLQPHEHTGLPRRLMDSHQHIAG